MTQRPNQWPEFIKLSEKNLKIDAFQSMICYQMSELKPNSLQFEQKNIQEETKINERATFGFNGQFSNLNKQIDQILSSQKSFLCSYHTSDGLVYLSQKPISFFESTQQGTKTPKSFSVNPIFKLDNGIENIIDNILNKKNTDRAQVVHYGKDEIGKKIMRKLVSVVDCAFRRSIKTKGITINNFKRQQAEQCLIQFLELSCDVKPKNLNESQIRIAKKLIYPLAFKRKERRAESEDMRHQILKKATKRELITFFKTYIGRKVFWDAFNTVLRRVGQSKDIKDSYKYLTYAQKIEKEISHQDTSQIS